MVDFFIIVPTFNSAQFIDRCLASIISTQAGNFGLRVHVQDGRSSDDTSRIAAGWAARGVTFASEQDDGLYDALNRAATRVRPGEIMTWLGSDDVLLPGTLATVASIFDQLPEVHWLTGLAFLGNERGESFTPGPPMSFTRNELAAGKYDNRSKWFVMQEGTFWRAELWGKAGGLDQRFKYAGDWDLWRRFAQHAPLHELTFPLARFTRRQGQKSEQMDSYYSEVDASPALPPVDDYFSYELTRQPWNDDWHVETRDRSVAVKSAEVFQNLIPLSGFMSLEGPYPKWDLPLVRWATGTAASARFSSAVHGAGHLILRARSPLAGQSIEVTFQGQPIGTCDLPKPDVFVACSFPVTVGEPTPTVAFHFAKSGSAQDGKRSVLFSALKLEPEIDGL